MGFHHYFVYTAMPNSDTKWNLTRQVRERMTCPNLHSSEVPYWPMSATKQGLLYDGKLPMTVCPDQGPDGYPLDDVEGNDWGNLLYSPYTNDPYGTNRHAMIVDYDPPNYDMVYRAGNVGDIAEFHTQFREFMRLNIAGVWFRISDLDGCQTKTHVKFKKIDEAIEHHDFDHDGKQTHKLWQVLFPETVASKDNLDF